MYHIIHETLEYLEELQLVACDAGQALWNPESYRAYNMDEDTSSAMEDPGCAKQQAAE